MSTKLSAVQQKFFLAGNNLVRHQAEWLENHFISKQGKPNKSSPSSTEEGSPVSCNAVSGIQSNKTDFNARSTFVRNSSARAAKDPTCRTLQLDQNYYIQENS